MWKKGNKNCDGNNLLRVSVHITVFSVQNEETKDKFCKKPKGATKRNNAQETV